MIRICQKLNLVAVKSSWNITLWTGFNFIFSLKNFKTKLCEMIWRNMMLICFCWICGYIILNVITGFFGFWGEKPVVTVSSGRIWTIKYHYVKIRRKTVLKCHILKIHINGECGCWPVWVVCIKLWNFQKNFVFNIHGLAVFILRMK